MLKGFITSMNIFFVLTFHNFFLQLCQKMNEHQRPQFVSVSNTHDEDFAADEMYSSDDSESPVGRKSLLKMAGNSNPKKSAVESAGVSKVYIIV